MTDLYRRKALCLLGSGLALAAGCSEADGDENGADGESGERGDDATETDDSGGGAGTETETEPDDRLETGSIETGDLPAYASVLADTDDEEYFYGVVDYETFELIAEGDGSDDGGDQPADPLLANPLSIAVVGYFVLVGLASAESGPVYSQHDESAEGEGYILFTREVNLLTGSYDFDGMVAGFRERGYAEVVAEDDRAVFYDEGSGEAVGVTGSVFVYAYDEETAVDATRRVERFVNAAVGDAPLKHEVDEEFGWLLRAGDAEGVALGLYDDATLEADGESVVDSSDTEGSEDDGLEFSADPFAGARGVQQHLDLVSDESRPSASAVVRYGSEADVDADRLTTNLGTEAESVSFVRDGRSVGVEATFDGDGVDGQASLSPSRN